MKPSVQLFLEAVLGDGAAAALKKAADRSDALSTVMGSRTVYGWVEFASRWGYEGEVPGLPGSYLRMQKSERGGMSGEVRVGKCAYEFQDSDSAVVAASVCVAIGADEEPDEDLRDAELVGLGKSIDVLIKTHAVSLAKASADDASECLKCGGDKVKQYVSEEDGDLWRCPECDGSADLDKTGFTAPGKEAPQKPPSGALGQGFTPPTAKQSSRKRPMQVRLTQSEATQRCSVCEESQFRGDRFMGCYCLKDLAKHSNVEAVEGGYRLTLDPEYWTRQDAELLLDIVAEGGDQRIQYGE